MKDRPNQHERQHAEFPTVQEVIDAYEEVAHSDHLPVLGRVPLRDGSTLNIISLNTLQQTEYSGIGSFTRKEGFDRGSPGPDRDACARNHHSRYERMMNGLLAGAKQHQVDVIFLQETDVTLASRLLKEKLGEDWDIISNRKGLLVAYNKRKYDGQDISASFSEYDSKGMISLELKNRVNNEEIVVHNIWGEFAETDKRFTELESQYNELLISSPGKTTVLFGDTNAHIAPLDDLSRNITTGLRPTYFNNKFSNEDILQDQLDESYQIPDYPDGGFYATPDGEIKQIETETLGFITGEIVHDERPKDQINPILKQERVLMLDSKYRNENQELQNVIGRRVEFTYQLTSNSFNEKQVKLIFDNKADFVKFISDFQIDEADMDINLKQDEFTVIMPRLLFMNVVSLFSLNLIHEECDQYLQRLLKDEKKESSKSAFTNKEEFVRLLIMKTSIDYCAGNDPIQVVSEIKAILLENQELIKALGKHRGFHLPGAKTRGALLMNSIQSILDNTFDSVSSGIRQPQVSPRMRH